MAKNKKKDLATPTTKEVVKSAREDKFYTMRPTDSIAMLMTHIEVPIDVFLHKNHIPTLGSVRPYQTYIVN